MERKQTDTLCWSCKRSLNSDEYNCAWSDKGIPVEGWEASKGKVFELSPLPSGEKRLVQSYCVHNCPLYVQDQEFNTVSEFCEKLMEMYGSPRYLSRQQLIRLLERYEQDTGKKVPKWVLVEWTYTHTRRNNNV